jgi:hypothetical protein
MKSVLSFLVVLGLANAASADTAALQNCRLLKDPAARLVCYDAIDLPATTAVVPTVPAAATAAPAARPAATAAPATAAAAATTVAAPAAPPAPAATAAPPAPAAPAAVAAAVPRPAPPADPAANFGLEYRAPVAAADALASFIAGAFPGWRPNGRIQLANGQVWQITDGSEAAYDLRDPAVRITRGFAGTFFMEITGVAQTPRVRRVQ